MNDHINSPKYSINDNVVILDHINLNKFVDGFPTFGVTINEEKREYFFKYDGNDCQCGQSQYMFGYIESNNSVSAYCIHCNKKSKLGVKLVKNVNNRDSKHLYYTQHQKDLSRFFCELCLNEKSPLNVHHITEVQHGGGDEPENLQLLCKYCHDLTHSLRKAVKRGL